MIDSESIDFRGFAFPGAARFDSATFSGAARFRGQSFTHDVFFNGAEFGGNGKADFGLATFERVAQFDGAAFQGEVDFNAVWGKRTFSLAGARFGGVPDFIQAHFEEAPRLDNVRVEGQVLPPREGAPKEGEKLPRRKRLHRWLLPRSKPYRSAHYLARRVIAGIAEESALRDVPARWRALKRLAIDGHDTERELQFFSGEMRSARYAGDWPWPRPFLSGKAWGGVFRFWFGLLYQAASDFGRSLARPAAFWLLAVILGAVVYVSQSPQVVDERVKGREAGSTALAATLGTAWDAWRGEKKNCYAGQPAPAKDKNGDTPIYVGALSPSLQDGTDLANEAWHLAFRNAFIVLDGSGEAAHRTYGCLYGVELYGGSNPLAVVPSAISTASAIQKLFSALMIFLFGLALRNMLKIK